MSPRAAWRLEALDFPQVYDYVAGKADWGSFGLPLEGVRGSESRVGAHARRDPATCRLDERLADVRCRLGPEDLRVAFVVNEANVLLGLLGRRALESEGERLVERVMTAGPSTVRPSLHLQEAVERMRQQAMSVLPVTRSDGVLLGVLTRADAERALAELDAAD